MESNIVNPIVTLRSIATGEFDIHNKNDWDDSLEYKMNNRNLKDNEKIIEDLSETNS